MHLVIKLIGCIWDEITQEELVTINKKLRSPAGRTTISNPQERGSIFMSPDGICVTTTVMMDMVAIVVAFVCQSADHKVNP
jgi:hypothetical protein